MKVPNKLNYSKTEETERTERTKPRVIPNAFKHTNLSKLSRHNGKTVSSDNITKYAPKHIGSYSQRYSKRLNGDLKDVYNG